MAEEEEEEEEAPAALPDPHEWLKQLRSRLLGNTENHTARYYSRISMPFPQLARRSIAGGEDNACETNECIDDVLVRGVSFDRPNPRRRLDPEPSSLVASGLRDQRISFRIVRHLWCSRFENRGDHCTSHSLNGQDTYWLRRRSANDYDRCFCNSAGAETGGGHEMPCAPVCTEAPCRYWTQWVRLLGID
eukprot:1565961-Amphidinium_carterae.2